ncbi:uncharacterized protein LOC131144931 [Malania oleifera]|uniref:uncharacterized protein LOC131144931 n=1 Tax=Malania oleifera TaxID=397392 RepID=UPI0025AE9032|nr:uncharacterized protein LOC131144931 [Malania oleifera]
MRRDFGGTSYPPVHHGCTIDQFTLMKPSSFEGGTDPIKVEIWMQEMEKILVVLNYTEEQKVLFAIFKLAGEAERWWHAMKLLEVQRVVWVSKHYMHGLKIPAGVSLETQHAAKLIELSCFAPYVVPDEFKKERMFKRGLRQEIYKQVTVLKMQDFSELVDRATVEEEGEQRDVGAPS